jgi:hypothetical protein
LLRECLPDHTRRDTVLQARPPMHDTHGVKLWRGELRAPSNTSNPAGVARAESELEFLRDDASDQLSDIGARAHSGGMWPQVVYDYYVVDRVTEP